MKQYCRYCANAIDYDDSLVCVAKAPCGNGGSGKEYPMRKANQANKCNHFDFNPNDLLGCDENGNFRQYKPRAANLPKAIDQLDLKGNNI